ARRVGIRELTIPGITVNQSLMTPRQLDASFRDPNRPLPEYVFTRVLPNPITGEDTDPERALRRRFDVPHAGEARVTAKGAITPGPEALALLDDTPGFAIEASSTFDGLPRYAPR